MMALAGVELQTCIALVARHRHWERDDKITDETSGSPIVVVVVVNRGWAKGYFLNAAIGRMSVAFPEIQFRSIHMSGKLHVNDDTSRGAETAPWKLHLAKKICEAVFRGLTTMNPYRQSVKVFEASVLNLSVEDEESPEDAALRIANAIDAFLCL